MILLKLEIMCDVYFLQRRNFPTGCDELAVATDRQRHEDQEYSSPPAHCLCNDPGIFAFVSVLILAMIQDQALVASKHYLVETEDKNLADPAVHVHPEHGYGHPKGHRKADADLVRFPNPLA